MQCLSCKREINSRNVPCPYCGARQDIETLTTEELKEEPKQEISPQNLMTSPPKEEQTPVENWFQEKNRKEQEQIYLKGANRTFENPEFESSEFARKFMNLLEF